MIKEVAAGLYKFDIPLPGSPLVGVNAYAIISERNLIIDTGMNRVECMNAMQACLRELEVDLSRTDFFITHMHPDHLGLVWKLATETSAVYFNEPDAQWVRSSGDWKGFVEFARLNGFPENELKAIIENHPGFMHGSKDEACFSIVKEGDRICIGEYQLECLETPGHTMGHMCLYDAHKRIFVSGDHVLQGISPTIQLWSEGRNPLKDYLASLDKVHDLHIEAVLPGHGTVFRDCKGRVEELKHHHQRRLDEILSILQGGDKNAYQVASQMSWDITDDYGPWDLFPVLQKLFATGEAISHLKYLEERGIVIKKVQGSNIAVFCG